MGKCSTIRFWWLLQFCEYTKDHGIMYFQWLNVMVCKLYLNKTKSGRLRGWRYRKLRNNSWESQGDDSCRNTVWHFTIEVKFSQYKINHSEHFRGLVYIHGVVQLSPLFSFFTHKGNISQHIVIPHPFPPQRPWKPLIYFLTLWMYLFWITDISKICFMCHKKYL